MFNRPRFLAYLAIAGLAILASATGLANGFALDDLALVVDNARVHSLHNWWTLFATPYWPPQHGASLYRPIVTIGYALQWWMGHANPWAFHVTSIALYTGVSILVLALLLELVQPAAALAGAALFAIHPVHVEAVANVVGQSELIAAVAVIAASVVYLRARQTGDIKPGSTAAIAVLFAIGCLSKEHALLLPAILIALELFGVDHEGRSTPTVQRVRALAPLYVTLGAIVVTYLVVRTSVVGGLLGEKHLVPVDGVRRLWVMFVVVPEWVRLLAWPARLSADYSPHQIAIPDGPGPEIVGGVVIVLAVVAGFFALGKGDPPARTERRVARLALAWMAITLLPVSNLFSVMLVAERTLLVPSVGAMLLASVASVAALRRVTAPRSARNVRLALGVATACLIVAGTIRSRSRQRVWRDDATLFAQTADDAPRSYRAQFFYGQMLFAEGERAEGERRLRLAIALNPTPSDVSPLNYLATQYRDAGLCRQALPLYERAIRDDAQRPDVRYGLAACLLATGRASDARRLAEDGVRRGDLRSLFLRLIAQSDSAALHGG